MESTIRISEKELHSTLQDFLEEKEKKPTQSIWNFSTVTGLALVFTTFTYIGHAIGTEIFGFEGLPIINSLMTFAPYIGGALFGLLVLSMFRSKSEKKEKEIQEEIRVQETYDKLDKFLYNNEAAPKTKSFTSSKKKSSFRINVAQKLMRSRTDRYLSGVCGGLAKHLGISSTVLRGIFLAALFLGYGSFFLVYIALAIVMPKEPVDYMDDFN